MTSAPLGLCYCRWPVSRTGLFLFALIGLAFAAPVAAAPAFVDSGRYVISREGKRLGTEDFALQSYGDSLVLSSYVVLVLHEGSKTDTLVKIG